MSNLAAVSLGGYQGSGSILSASLNLLEQTLTATELFGPIATSLDVTSQGETAGQLFQSVNQGSRQICYAASGYLTAYAPDLAALDLPFTVNNRETALGALDGAAGRWLGQQLAENSNFKIIGFWDNGFRHISNSVRALYKPSDTQGLKIRTLDSAIYREALNALGFTAVTTDVSELKRVLQSGELQAQENPLTNYNNFKIYENHPYVSLTGHFFGVLLLVCNARWFDSLSDKQQQAVTQAASIATQHQRTLAARQDSALQGDLVKKGVQIVDGCELDIAAMQMATDYIVHRERQSLSKPIVEHYLDLQRTDQ
jgi:TRAP-type C4-dicarboxylate transport system substrate-binding protein